VRCRARVHRPRSATPNVQDLAYHVRRHRYIGTMSVGASLKILSKKALPKGRWRRRRNRCGRPPKLCKKGVEQRRWRRRRRRRHIRDSGERDYKRQHQCQGQQQDRTHLQRSAAANGIGRWWRLRGKNRLRGGRRVGRCGGRRLGGPTRIEKRKLLRFNRVLATCMSLGCIDEVVARRIERWLLVPAEHEQFAQLARRECRYLPSRRCR